MIVKPFLLLSIRPSCFFSHTNCPLDSLQAALFTAAEDFLTVSIFVVVLGSH